MKIDLLTLLKKNEIKKFFFVIISHFLMNLFVHKIKCERSYQKNRNRLYICI